jgi:hypothetical protein
MDCCEAPISTYSDTYAGSGEELNENEKIVSRTKGGVSTDVCKK